MASFVLSFFPLDVLDEIWDLIESVSEGFLTYCSIAHSLSLSRPDMTEILLKGCKIANHPSILQATVDISKSKFIRN